MAAALWLQRRIWWVKWREVKWSPPRSAIIRSAETESTTPTIPGAGRQRRGIRIRESSSVLGYLISARRAWWYVVFGTSPPVLPMPVPEPCMVESAAQGEQHVIV